MATAFVAQTFRFDGCCARHRYKHCQALCGGLSQRTAQASIRAEALSYSAVSLSGAL